MTNNGGGSICLGEYLHNALFPGNITKPVYDIPSSDLAQEFVVRSAQQNNRNTFWSAGRWTDLNDVPFVNTDPSWMNLGKVGWKYANIYL